MRLNRKKLLARHPLTARLKDLGISQKCLDSKIVFDAKNAAEFGQWSIRASEFWPINLMPEMHVWCALKWLILDDPPESRDRRDAWHLVSMYLTKPIFEEASANANALQWGRDKANMKRREAADKKKIEAYLDWEKKSRVLEGSKTPGKRLELFFTVKSISSYHQKRYRELLQEDRLKERIQIR